MSQVAMYLAHTSLPQNHLILTLTGKEDAVQNQMNIICIARENKKRQMCSKPVAEMRALQYSSAAACCRKVDICHTSSKAPTGLSEYLAR